MGDLELDLFLDLGEHVPLASTHAGSDNSRFYACSVEQIKRWKAPPPDSDPSSDAEIFLANLAGAKTRAANRVVNRLLLTQEHGPHKWRLVRLPAVSEWSDFDDRHGKILCIFLLIDVSGVFIEPKEGHAPTTSADKHTGAIILRPDAHPTKCVVRLLPEGVLYIKNARDQGHRTLRCGYCEA